LWGFEQDIMRQDLVSGPDKALGMLACSVMAVDICGSLMKPPIEALEARRKDVQKNAE
jgi:hypothetical protein